MQQLYKLNGGSAIPYSGEAVITAGKVITRPDEALLVSLGYRPMGISALPEYDEATQLPVVERYEMSADGSEIVPVYALRDLIAEDEPEAAPTYEERLTALEEENAQLKEALDLLLSGG